MGFDVLWGAALEGVFLVIAIALWRLFRKHPVSPFLLDVLRWVRSFVPCRSCLVLGRVLLCCYVVE